MKKLIAIPTKHRIEVGDILKIIKPLPLDELTGENNVGKFVVNKNPYVNKKQGFCEKYHIYLIETKPKDIIYPAIIWLGSQNIESSIKGVHSGEPIGEFYSLVLATTNPKFPRICTLDRDEVVKLMNEGNSYTADIGHSNDIDIY